MNCCPFLLLLELKNYIIAYLPTVLHNFRGKMQCYCKFLIMIYSPLLLIDWWLQFFCLLPVKVAECGKFGLYK